MASRMPDEDSLRDRWLLSYADFMTLLLALFVVLYSVSSVNEQKYASLAKSLTEAFQRPSALLLGESIKDLHLPEKQLDLQPVEQPGPQQVEELLAKFEHTLEEMGGGESVTVTAGEEWIDLVLDSSLLFSSASANIQAASRSPLQKLAKIISEENREIRVQGHTDNVPIATRNFPSNWELSATRAAAVVRFLADSGVESSLLLAVGYGDTEPRADNSTETGRSSNRRVVIQVSRQVATHPPGAVPSPPIQPAMLPDSKQIELSALQESTAVDEGDGGPADEDPFEKVDPGLLRQIYQMEFAEPGERVVDSTQLPESAAAMDNGVETIRKESGGLLIKGKVRQRDD